MALFRKLAAFELGGLVSPAELCQRNCKQNWNSLPTAVGQKRDHRFQVRSRVQQPIAGYPRMWLQSSRDPDRNWR